MASNVLICDPCSRLKKSSKAIKFCTDCDDALCSDCTTVHSALKITSGHHVVEVSDLTGRAFKLNKYCNDHQDMPLEFFCADHDCLLCRSCMANTHRTCGKILPIDVAAKGIKSSVMFDDIIKDIAVLRKSTKELVEDRQSNKNRVGQSKELILRKIIKFRSDIDKHLDYLENKLSTGVEALEKELHEKASTDLSEAETKEKDIEEIWEQINVLIKQGSESQLLIQLNAVKSEITIQSKNLQEFILSQETYGIDFEQVDLTSAISSIGLVKRTTSPCSVSYQLPKHMQAQKQQTHGIVPTRFEFEKKIYVPPGRITCIVVTDDNILLLCNDNHSANNLMAYTEDGTQVQTCTISSRIFGIAIIPHTEEAVVSLADVKIIQFVNIESLVPGRQLQVIIEDSSIYGIAVVRDTIIVGGSCGNVHFIEKMKGKCLKSIKIGTGTISSIVPFISAKDEVLYCSEYSGNKKVHSLKLDGTFISNCELENPIGMTLDSKRNVYVACYDFSELHRLTADCEVDSIMLTKSDRLNNPVSVAFNKTYSKLYVSNSGSDESILVFNCK